MAFVVSGLTDYVKENMDVIAKDIVLGNIGGDTIPFLAKQLGVKTSEILNVLNVDPTLQEATGCGFSAQGDTVLSERKIETAQIKVNEQYCLETLLGKFAEYKVRVGANEDALPFEAEIMESLIKAINKKLEKEIWLGDTSSNGLIDGFVTIAEGADSASTITATTSTGASAYEAIKLALVNIPEEIVDDATIFVSPSIFREYTQDLVSANLYHYDPNNGDFSEMFIPGSNVKVHKTYGLTGSNKIYASSFKNMVYGADLLNAKEEVKVWFSDDDDVYKVKVRFNSGVQTYFPDEVVVVTKQ